MKDKLKIFFKPRIWTVLLALVFITWQYIYAFRGIDMEALVKIRTYFGFGVSAINWNDFLVRTFSMALIWVFVAFIIFLLLWLAETYVVSSHNRKIERKYVNRPKEDFNHLLKERSTGLKKVILAGVWFSTGLILIPIGLFLLSGVMEVIRSNMVISYIVAAQESGQEIEFYSINLVVISFLATLPFWYLYSCIDVWCFATSRKDQDLAKIEHDHYSVPVVEPTEFEDSEDEEDENDTIPPSPVI